MAGAVRKIRPDEDNGDQLPPIDLYRLAVEEYRFQADFNWKRTQYFLAFNAAILAAGSAVSGRFGAFGVPVFALGVLACAFAFFAMRQQHDYFRAARDRMRRIEEMEGIASEIRVDTTSTLGQHRRSVSVTQWIYLLTAAIAVADVAGIIIVASS